MSHGTYQPGLEKVDLSAAVHLPLDEFEGIVTLSNGEREKPVALDISGGRDGVAPRVHRRDAEGAMRLGRGEVALDVENVVDDGMG